MTHQHGRTFMGHRRKAWSVAVIGALILTGFAGAAPAEAVASETPIPTWGTGPMPPSNPSGPQWQTGRVYAITRANGRIYLGGAFTQAVAPDGSTPVARPGLIAINAATGKLDAAFDARVNGQVWALAASPDGTTLYVGGQFTSMGGAGNRNLAAISSVTGLAVPGWKAEADQAVHSLAVSGDRVYAGGKFGTITNVSGPHARSRLVALNAADGSVVTAWSGGVTGDVECGRGEVVGPSYVRAITVSPDGARVYIGGCFPGFSGVGGQHLRALDATTGTLITAFQPTEKREVFAIAADGVRVYASQGGGGGEGTAFNPATGDTIWSVHGDGNFQGLAVMGGLVYFGGHFGGANLFTDGLGRNYDRNKLAAVDAATGAIHPYAAHTNSPLGIFVVRNSGNFLDVGGDFTLAGPESNMVKAAHFAQFPVAGGITPAPSPPATSPPSTTAPTTAPPGTAPPAPANTQVLGAVQASGYWLLGEAGTVYAFGAAGLYGTPAAGSLSGPAKDLQETPSGKGYWIVDTAGQVQAFGDARWLGNADRRIMVAGEQVTSLASTPSGNGYWLFTSRGRAFARGDARHLGDMAAVPLNGPVLDSIATPSGNGYYMVASDGGIFAFGDAAFSGSMGGRRLNSPVRSAVPDPDRVGYWLVAGDGGVFAFAAPFRGSAGSLRLNAPVVGMVSFGNGYLLVGSDGGVFNYSDRAFSGSLGSAPPTRPIVSVAALG